MNYLMMKMLGLHPMEEVAADGGQGGGATAAAVAPAAAATAEAAVTAPESAPAVPEVKSPGSLLGDLAKPADEKSAEDEAPTALPESYELKALDGVELDDAIMPQVQELFKDLGLPQEKAQEVFDKLMAMDAARQPSPEQVQQAYEQQAQDLNKQWGDECAKLPELGGANFNKSLETASQVMIKFGTPELRDFLTYSALGSNPEFFKFIHSIGQSMSPDTMEHGGAASPGPRSIEDRLWPTK